MRISSSSVSREWLERGRPHLRGEGYTVESPATPIYNCCAWAAGDDRAWWQPSDLLLAAHALGPMYWLPDSPHEYTVDAFVEISATLGYVECSSPELELGIEKVGIYADTSEASPQTDECR